MTIEDQIFLDRINLFLPGWEITKFSPKNFTDHFGFSTDFFSEILKSQRKTTYYDAIDKYFTLKFTTTDGLAKFLDTTTNNSKFLEFISKQKIDIVNGTLSKEIAMKDWSNIWLAFAAYALVIAVFFAFMFKHKHNPKELGEVSH